MVRCLPKIVLRAAALATFSTEAKTSEPVGGHTPEGPGLSGKREGRESSGGGKIREHPTLILIYHATYPLEPLTRVYPEFPNSLEESFFSETQRYTKEPGLLDPSIAGCIIRWAT